LFNFLILLLNIAFYYYFRADQERIIEYDAVLSKFCPTLPLKKRFHGDAILNGIVGLLSIPLFYALKYDFYILFHGNEKKWSRFNFAHYNKNTFEETMIDNKLENVDLQWNHTKNIFYILLRIIVLGLILIIAMSTSLLIDYNKNIILVITIKILLPLGLTMFAMLTYCKKMMVYLKVHEIKDEEKTNIPV
jgi:hypothetical protein